MKILVPYLKLFPITIFFFLVSSGSFAQNSFYGKAYFGSSEAALFPKEDMLGGISYEVEGFRELGFLIGKEISKKWAIETGLNFAAADLILQIGLVNGLTVLPPKHRYQLLSFPVMIRYSIFPFLYVNAGPILDIQRSENFISIDNQSGIGYLLGIGVQHYFNKVGFFIHPHFKSHAAFSFESTNLNLNEFGVQFGVGYKF